MTRVHNDAETAVPEKHDSRKRRSRRVALLREFHELSRIEQSARIREWRLAGATEAELVCITEWELDDVRRILCNGFR
jgi:hypothetical protein